MARLLYHGDRLLVLKNAYKHSIDANNFPRKLRTRGSSYIPFRDDVDKKVRDKVGQGKTVYFDVKLYKFEKSTNYSWWTSITMSVSG